MARPQEVPLTVVTDVRILHLFALSELDQVCHVDAVVELAWLDPRLAYPETQLPRGKTVKRASPDEVWQPSLMIMNANSDPSVLQRGALPAIRAPSPGPVRVGCSANPLIMRRRADRGAARRGAAAAAHGYQRGGGA